MIPAIEALAAAAGWVEAIMPLLVAPLLLLVLWEIALLLAAVLSR
jgi:hypothetical protein